MRPGIERLIEMLADLGMPDIALTTNGIRLAEMASILKQAGLRRINVSLDSLSPNTFRRLTGGGELQAVLRGIAVSLDAGLCPLKLNAVVIRKINDWEAPRLLDFAIARNCELRFIELMPIGPGAALFPDGFMPSEAVREILSAHFVLKPTVSERGSSSRRYSVVDAAGRRGAVGFISSCSAPFCGECARLRVSADGRLIGCLAGSASVPVREMLRAGNLTAVADAARAALRAKRTDRSFEQTMAMSSIGG